MRSRHMLAAVRAPLWLALYVMGVRSGFVRVSLRTALPLGRYGECRQGRPHCKRARRGWADGLRCKCSFSALFLSEQEFGQGVAGAVRHLQRRPVE